MLKLKDEAYGKENSIKSLTPRGKALRIWPLQERFELHASFTTLCRHNKEFTLVPVELPQPYCVVGRGKAMSLVLQHSSKLGIQVL